jgi:parallel beta-helix repeat protein
MPLSRAAIRFGAFLITISAAAAPASDIGQEIANQVSAASYQHYLDDLLYTHDGDDRGGMTGPDHDAAQANIVATLQSFGLSVELEPFTYQSGTHYNVVATQTGIVYPESYYVIGAHYDSANDPGADDDASGVAGVMEAARILSQYPTDYTIKYIAFDLEEYGLIGSEAYVDIHFSDDIRGMISMDMIAYDPATNKANIDGSSPYSPILAALKSAITQYGQGLGYIITSGMGGSDHMPFADAGFQACLLIERAWQSNPCYHEACDSVDTADYINYTYAAKMVRSAAGFLADNAIAEWPFDCSTLVGCNPADHGDQDCNDNGIWDHCDVLCGISSDANANGIPDECEPHETWYVDAANLPGPGSGTQDDPFCRIQDAINAAANGLNAVVEIIAADGVYTGVGNKDLDWGGKIITLRSANGPTSCIIDCERSGRGFYFHGLETPAARVNGFTVRNGNVTSSSPGSYYGGAVFCSSSSPTLTNCILTGNTAVSGGGLYCVIASPAQTASPSLINCVIQGNSAASGGGVYSGSYAKPRLTNCILWGNEPTAIDHYGSSSAAVRYSNVQGGYAGEGNIDVDPLFAFADDFHLLPGSSCIDAGTNSPSGALPSPDADGNPRPFDGDDDGMAVADMGIYEFNPALPTIAVSPARIEFYIPEEQALTQDLALSIRNAGGGTLIWELGASDVPWLHANSVQGQSTDEVDTVTLTANAASLAHGSYATTLAVASLQASNSPRTVQVVLYVSATYRVPSAHAIIQAAIDATSVPGDEVLVADGTYTGTGNKNLDFHGKRITVRSESGDPGTCIIDCEDSGRGFYFHNGERSDSLVDGLTIRRANASGVACTSASPRLSRCTISGNTASYGGGMNCTNANPALTNCLIQGNTASSGGGGIYSSNSNPTLIDCTIDSNTTSGSFGYGGGIYYNYSSHPVVKNCTISGNSATHAGGGAYCSDSRPTFSACAISGNTGTGVYSYHNSHPLLTNCVITQNTGIGVYCSYADITVTSCTIDNNHGGGVYSDCSPDPVFAGCMISRNTAPSGAGLWCYDSNPVLTECTITGNTASGGAVGGLLCISCTSPTLTKCDITANHGSGLYCSFSNPRLTNCTITKNTKSALQCISTSSPVMTNCTISGNGIVAGGGLYCSGASPVFINSILWGDTPQEIYQTGSDNDISISYSDIQGGYPGTGNIDADPLFVDAPNGDFHLSANSPCIDAGDPASDFSLEPEPDGGRINMGAYGNTPEAECKAWLYIEGYGLVSKTRVGRTLFDYQINVRLENASASDVTDVVAELLSVPDNVTIIDGQVTIGTVAAGATVTSTDTFTIRVDRSTPVSALAISWRVTYSTGDREEARTIVGTIPRSAFESRPGPVPVPAPTPVETAPRRDDRIDGGATGTVPAAGLSLAPALSDTAMASE